MIWNEINLLYLSSSGKIQVLDPVTLESICKKDIDKDIKLMILTPKYLIVVNQENTF